MVPFLQMSKWAEVVVHPLGLAGFALFLVFMLLAGTMRRSERRWVVPVAVAMAVIGLVGGLGLAYWQGREPGTPVGVQQETHGDASPAVADVEGNVTITITQPDNEKREEKKDEKEQK